MNFYLVLISCLLISVTSSIKDYSIDIFLNTLEGEGYYEILYNIKCKFGTDVTIAFCQEFVKSKDCERYVKVYLPSCAQNPKYLLNKELLKNYLNQKEVKKVLLTNNNNNVDHVDQSITKVAARIDTLKENQKIIDEIDKY